MKKFLFKLCVFIILTFVVYCGFVIIIGEFGDEKLKKNMVDAKGAAGHTYSRLQDAEKVKNVDLLIFGTSLAFKGYDTRIFEKNNIHTFNLGTAGETPVQTEYLVKRYAKAINPTLVILETNPEWFTTNRIESAVDIISNLPYVDLGALKMAIKVNNIKLYNNLIYSFYRANLLKEKYKEPAKKYSEFYISGGGFSENKMMYYTPKKISSKKLVFLKKQKKAFDRTIHYLKQNNLNYILIMPPLSKNRFDSFLNMNEINSYFSKKGKYLNFNSKVNLTDTLHFGDSRHLNQKGVVIFDKEVIRYLKKNPELFN